MATSYYKANLTIVPFVELPLTAILNGNLTIGGTLFPASYTNQNAITSVTVANLNQFAIIHATVPPGANTQGVAIGDVTATVKSGLSTSPYSTLTPTTFSNLALALAPATTSVSNSSSTATSSFTTDTVPHVNSTPTASASSSNQDGAQSTSVPPFASSISNGTLAGVAVGCAIGAALLTAMVFLCWRRSRSKSNRKVSRRPEKQTPLLRDHGEAIFVAGTGSSGLAKHLPQAESDASVRSSATRTLDQIAMHVENYYAARNKIMLSTEHEFELENTDSPYLPEPLITLLHRSSRTEELIKHTISNYILSMIDFENSNANGHGNLLPRVFRKQIQKSSRDQSSLIQAYSKWRVLTAFLYQSSGDEEAYVNERDSVIETAARHICKAFEVWATADEATRHQNMVGIMKRASELGILLFRQPGRFEWQWQSPSGLVILPGLYKTTDQDAVLLPTPLHLVEPTVVEKL